MSQISQCAETYTKLLNSYKDAVSGTAGTESWQGPSADNIISQAESFVGEYDAIASQLSSYAKACDLLEQYNEAKNYYDQYAAAASSSEGDVSAQNAQYANEYSSQMDSLNDQIAAALQEASSPSLSATSNASSMNVSSILITSLADTLGSLSDLPDSVQAAIISLAEGQIGVPWESMNYGPTDGAWGCAQLVAYLYNQVLFGGNQVFGGSTTCFWGNVATPTSYVNQGFELVSAAEAQPGDVVCFMDNSAAGNPYSSANNCEHVGVYIGNGMMIDAAPSGGVQRRGVDYYGKAPYFLHYTGNA